jgi:hypothetical protein
VNLATAIAVDRCVVSQLTESNSHLAKQLEYNAIALKGVKALLKRSEEIILTVGTRIGHPAALSRLHLIIIVGCTVTKWHIPIQAKHVCTQRRGTSARLPSQKIWEGPKSTVIDF